ncbi:hypothetical protein JCGZ_01973 [Jatropha curcas]|uniref:Uncharacterized protein n=1 Tax=Jatropha curcas TaxID=180498 RepID=A0A067LEL2_JATCU|nr:hypothetical protein JCGZ_01973 [Jatropha curcas]
MARSGGQRLAGAAAELAMARRVAGASGGAMRSSLSYCLRLIRTEGGRSASLATSSCSKERGGVAVAHGSAALPLSRQERRCKGNRMKKEKEKKEKEGRRRRWQWWRGGAAGGVAEMVREREWDERRDKRKTVSRRFGLVQFNFGSIQPKSWFFI